MAYMEGGIKRRTTKRILVGDVPIGGDEPIAVQSMANVPMHDYIAAVDQINALKSAGCAIVRVAVPDMEAVCCLGRIVENVDVPVVADIHFDYKLAIESAAAGAAKIRINPGNIGDESRVKAVADCCRQKNIPIRIGINGGSLEKNILKKYGNPVPKALVESAEYHMRMLEKYDFDNIVISIKASDIKNTVEANRIISSKYDHPIHLGLTEAGTMKMGSVKSAIGIGSLLLDGIGDTIRVSLTADPLEEVKVAYNILNALGLNTYKNGIELISCPTCARCRVDVIKYANEFEKKIEGLEVKRNIKVALMGCEVNGPGEAKECDVGIACGLNEGLLFVNGEIVKKVPAERITDTLMEYIKEL